jgi:preprotein translocase subunit SecG
MTILLYTSVVLLFIVCVFLILIVLIQKGRGGGLASAFGGAGGNTAFGSKTGDVLTWATSIVFGIFLILSVVTNVTADKIDKAYKARLTAEQDQSLPTPANAPAESPLNAPGTQPAP